MRLALSCRCGAVRGEVDPASPRLARRIVCYCDDCQAYARYLGRPDLLDARGGTDLVLIPPSALRFSQGQDKIGAVRLSAKGPYRWRASCCGSPLGNTGKPAIPFVSLPTSVFRAEEADAGFGARRTAILGQYATGGPLAGAQGFSGWLRLGIVAKVLGWRLAGRAWPNPFFQRATAKPAFPVTVLSQAERAQLKG